MENKNQLNKEKILQFIQENQKYIEKEFGITKIALFGSYARGEQTPQSDIDILIEMPEPDFFKRFDLKYFLEKHLKKEVEIGYIDSVKSFIRRNIEKDIIYAFA
jgi:uncharacterized protein